VPPLGPLVVASVVGNAYVTLGMALLPHSYTTKVMWCDLILYGNVTQSQCQFLLLELQYAIYGGLSPPKFWCQSTRKAIFCTQEKICQSSCYPDKDLAKNRPQQPRVLAWRYAMVRWLTGRDSNTRSQRKEKQGKQ
jgi:hypothetical protein